MQSSPPLIPLQANIKESGVIKQIPKVFFWGHDPIFGNRFVKLTLLSTVGAVVAGVNLIFFKTPAREPRPSVGFRRRFLQFDPIGTILFVPAIVCLLLALQWGGTTYSWGSGRVIALFVVFAVCIVAFAAVQWWLGDDATGQLSLCQIDRDKG